MTGLHTRLSPLNFRGLLAKAGVTPNGGESSAMKGKRQRPIECWRCAECLQVYEWEDEAEECCVDPAPAAASNSDCPVCGESYNSPRDAADCCLWKDLDQAQRYAMADAVEGGQSWLEAMGLNHLGAAA